MCIVCVQLDCIQISICSASFIHFEQFERTMFLRLL